MNNLFNLRQFLFNYLPTKFLIYFINLNKNYKITITQIDKNIYCVKQSTLELFTCRRRRFFKYKAGIESRLTQLREKYFINDIVFNENDLVIDCGSNIGEVPISIRFLGNKIRVIAIEPDPIEFRCLKMNLSADDVALNLFLGSNTMSAYATFNNESGDTHIMTADHEVIGNSRYSIVKLTSLDEILQESKLGIIKLIKIEVEGYEPEVLSGSKNILRQTKYIAIDTCQERGNKDTFTDCHSFLLNAGFKMIKNNDRNSALFVNCNL